MALTSRSGAWRLPAFYNAIRNGYPLAITRYGMFYCADLASEIQFMPSWEASIKSVVQQSRGLFIDIGANIGFYSVMAAKGGNRVLAIEPNKRAFSCLAKNIKANGLEGRIEALNVAAWYKEGRIKLQEGRHTDVSIALDEEGETLAVSLDHILSQDCPALVKIDAEGSEPRILFGAQGTLDRCHPKVIFEALSKEKLERCTGLLGGGYVIKQLDRTNYLAS